MRFPSIELLRKLVRYEPDTGKLFWLPRTADIVPSVYARNPFNTKHANTEIRKRNLGYVVVSMFLNTIPYELRGHRVAWALQTGAWPKDELDHKNGIRDDNRFDNLREATHAQNNQNKPAQSNNKSGHKGVHRHSQNPKWVSQIRVDGKRRNLGSFDTVEEAAAAYNAAAKALQKEFKYESEK